jgi:hypothetical protein
MPEGDIDTLMSERVKSFDWLQLQRTVCNIFAPFFSIWTNLISIVLIGSIWKRRRYLPELIVQIGKRGAKMLHTVYVFRNYSLKNVIATNLTMKYNYSNPWPGRLLIKILINSKFLIL